MNIGDNIKKYRKVNKMTQTELANKLNKSLRTIQKYESNQVTPSLQVLGDIANALNISINELTDQRNHESLPHIKSHNVSSEHYSNEYKKGVEKMAYDRVKKMIDNHLSNLSNEDLITYKNKLDYKNELNNKIPIYDKLEPKQLELVYLSEIDSLKSIIKIQDNMIKELESMVDFQRKMIDQLLGGGTDGK